ncbi:MAG TPA: hypothetical protein VHM90_16250, partial [Phycisphaerae bacterium]|nr:hypothetical protein [Phycisphaerae bacterium]
MKRFLCVFALLATGAGLAIPSAGASQVQILSPLPQDVIHDNSGNLTVSVQVDPPLGRKPVRNLRILLDGNPASPDSQDLTFTVMGVERGEHFVQAVLLDDKGQTIAVSDTIY